MDENIRNFCRICLDVESKHVSILDPTVLLHIKSCLVVDISIGDDLSKDICVNCVCQLSEFYNFQQNARCSQDWLESSSQDNIKKIAETKTYVQPLPDSEYNSDSLLEFLNNNANIEEYLNNLGKEDIPSIVNMIDTTNEYSIEIAKSIVKVNKQVSPKKRDSSKSKKCMKMDIDVLDSDIEVVKGILFKGTEPKAKVNNLRIMEKAACFGCKSKFDSVQKLSQHLTICDNALRTCVHCNVLFDSKKQMKQHSLTHGILTQMSCTCGKQFTTKELLLHHYNICQVDQVTTNGFTHRCKQCKMIFKDRFELYKHAKDHLIKSAERICDICGHTFIGNETLAKHKKEEHERPDNFKYRCKICNETSESHKDMYMHVQKHTTKQMLSQHLCESCGHCFATKGTLMRHSLLHAHTKEQQCLSSSKKFPDTKSRGEHLSERREIVMCDKCGQKVNKYKLDSHTCV